MITRTCSICGKELTHKQPYNKYCSSVCYYKVQKGRPHSAAHSKAIGNALRGKPKTKEHVQHVREGKKVEWSSPERHKKQSAIRKGKTWEEIYGKENTPKLKAKLVVSLRKRNSAPGYREAFSAKHRKRWKDATPEWRAWHLKRTLEARFPKGPNGFENQVLTLIREFNLPLKFVGTGEVVIRGKCPDFIGTNKKIIVEVCYEYFKTAAFIADRIKLFREEGYEVLFLEEEDLRDKNWKSRCVGKIIGLIGGK